ncbi:MAG: hypothetical protein V3T83_22840 [Acidobacteriota bacterium]
MIYLDGNQFGRLKSKHCKRADLQAEFDLAVQRCRRKALQGLLEKIDSEDGWRIEINGEALCRLETLLWGGDELIWVVPAWKGWDALASFYAASKDCAFGGERLTHAGSLVFCSHKAPIHRITRLAKNLVSLVKGPRRQRQRQRNLYAYQVLETYDDVGVSLEDYRRQRWPDFESEEGLILDGEAMGKLAGQVADIKTAVPRRKLQRIAQTSLGGSGQKEAADRLDKILEGILYKAAPEALDGLNEAFGPGIPRWLHLADLWDYLPEGEN